MIGAFNNPFSMGGAPQPDTQDPAMEFAANQRADDEAVRQAIFQLIQTHLNDSRMNAAQPALKGIGMAGKAAVKNWLLGGTRTLSPASALAGSTAAPAYQAASTAGGIGSAAAANTGAAAAGLDTIPVSIASQYTPAATSQLAGAASGVLGGAGLAYTGYEGVSSGLKHSSEINSFLRERGDVLSDDERDRLRDKAFRSEMVDSGVGAGSGALSGAALGSVVPGIGTAIGAGAGAVIGGMGGLIGAMRTYKDSDHPVRDTAQAMVRFHKNPFRR